MKSYTVQFGSGDPRGFTGLSPTFLLFWNLSSGTTNAPPSISELVTGKTGLYTFNYGVTQPIAFLLDAATTSPGTSGRYVSGQLDPADRADEYGTTLTAYGLTMIAQANNIGTTLVAQGSTLVGMGGTLIAQGSTLVGFGATLIAQGSTLVGFGASLTAFSISQLALGNSLVSLGNTSISLGMTNSANIIGYGNTAVALGNTSVALGISGAVYSFLGTTSSSMGSTGIDPTTIFGFLMRAQEMAEGGETYTKSTGILDFFTRGATLIRRKTIADTSTTTTKS